MPALYSGILAAACLLICSSVLPATGAEPVLRQGQAHYDEEDRLRIEVDEFAAEFFKLDVAERRRRWQELRSRCAFAAAPGATSSSASRNWRNGWAWSTCSAASHWASAAARPNA